MKRVFVDSGGWFAHLVAEDGSRATAHDLFARALRERWSPVTTNVVVIETYALWINRALDGRRVGLEMLDDMAATFPAACRTRAVTGPAKRSHPCARPVASARKRRPKAMNARSSAQHPGTAPLDGHVSQGDTRPSMRDSVGGVSNTVVSPKLTVVRPRDSLARTTGSRPYPIDSRP